MLTGHTGATKYLSNKESNIKCLSREISYYAPEIVCLQEMDSYET